MWIPSGFDRVSRSRGRQMAQADVACKGQTHPVQRLASLEAAEQTKFINTHGGEIGVLLARRAKLVQAAQAALASRGLT